MLVVTTNTLKNKNYVELGVVKGSTVQCKHFGKDLGASFKTLVGGEIKAYTEMMEEARNIAYNRMIENAKEMGADAIIGCMFASSAIMQGASEMMAYGTAIKFIE